MRFFTREQLAILLWGLISFVVIFILAYSTAAFIAGWQLFLTQSEPEVASAIAQMTGSWASVLGGLLAALAAVGVIWQTREQIRQQVLSNALDDARRRLPALVRINAAMQGGGQRKEVKVLLGNLYAYSNGLTLIKFIKFSTARYLSEVKITLS